MWETRYALLQPSRSAGGFRLYSEDDESRVRRMRALQQEGLSASEAAHIASAPTETSLDAAAADLDAAAQELRTAVEGFDEAEAQRVLDRLLTALTLDSVLTGVVLPTLREIGRRWEEGELSVAQEHFATHVIRARLLALARGWGSGSGPRALLACAPGELHDVGLICFGLALRSRGWTITFLGPATPLDTLAEAAERIRPVIVVLSASSPERLEGAAGQFAALAARVPLALGGQGVDESIAEALGARLLSDNPVTEAERLSRSLG
jgi:MerR family transcriptional regulator, light-induced transcriptional regulator